MLTVKLAGLAVAVFILLFVIMKMMKGRSKDTTYMYLAVPGFSVVETIGSQGGLTNYETLARFARRLHKYWSIVWPKLKAAYGLPYDLPFPVDKVRVFMEPWDTKARIVEGGKPVDVRAQGETIFSWPKYNIWLMYDPEGVGAFGWELRNVAKHEASLLLDNKPFDEWDRSSEADRMAEEIIAAADAETKK